MKLSLYIAGTVYEVFYADTQLIMKQILLKKTKKHEVVAFMFVQFFCSKLLNAKDARVESQAELFGPVWGERPVYSKSIIVSVKRVLSLF